MWQSLWSSALQVLFSVLRPCNKSRLPSHLGRLTAMYPRISQGRRMLGISIDWLAAYAVTLGFFSGGGSFLERSRGVGGTVLLVLTLEYLLLVTFGGSSFGHRIVGLKVVRFSDGGAVTPIQALIRTVLMVTIVAAITFDENGRGINERLSNTVLVKREP